MVSDVPIGRQHVIQARGEAVLGRQAVFDRHHGRAGDLGQDAAEGVAGVQVTDHAAAEVREDDGRRGRILLLGPVEARCDAPLARGDGQGLDADAGLRPPAIDLAAFGRGAASLLGR